MFFYKKSSRVFNWEKIRYTDRRRVFVNWYDFAQFPSSVFLSIASGVLSLFFLYFFNVRKYVFYWENDKI